MRQTLQICSGGFKRPTSGNQKKKRKKERDQAEKQNFLALGNLVRSSNKVFIESQRLFLCQQKEDMIEWQRDRLCNVNEIKNNEMIQSFLIESS